MSKCRLEKIACVMCNGASHFWGGKFRDPKKDLCPHCNGTGFRDYRIPEALVEQVIAYLENNKTYPATSGMPAYMGDRYVDEEAKSLLAELTEDGE